MDPLLALKAIVMGIVEGLTEFLPVSSTGHLIVAGRLLAFPERIANTFEIFIQLGTVVAVGVYFLRDLRTLLQRGMERDASAVRLLGGVIIAFVPAAVVGLLARNAIKTYLFNPVTVGIALVVGGVIMLAVERWVTTRAFTVPTVADVRPRSALMVGVAQVASLFPGMSRSAATIVGGLLAGMSRAAAVHFSFYLAIPTLGVASIYDLYKELPTLNGADLPVFAIGLVVSFIVALFVIRFLLNYVAKNTFRPFAWYRIVAGALMILAFGVLRVF